MTDNTQPLALMLAEQYDYGDPAAHSNTWKVAVCTELRRQHARIAELEAQIEALSGVQALSAAPAEQQATKETSGGFHVWRDISTAPKDGSHFVATGYNYGLYSEGRHICVAQWFRGCWMETSDWNEASELQHLTHWLPLPSPPDNAAELNDLDVSVSPQQAAPKAVPGDALDEALRERDDAEDFIDALLDEVLGHERPEWSSSYGRADALNDVQERMTALHKPAVDKAWGRFQSAMAAPQQEAQEPVMIYHGRCTIDCGEHGHHDIEMLRMIPAGSKLYTAPQPAPAAAAGPSLQHLHDLLYTAQRTTGDAQAQAIAEARSWPKVSGVSRDEGHSRALLVFFAAEPTDDEVRAVHDTLAAQPAPLSDDAKDAARYRWLRDPENGGDLSVAKWLSVCDEYPRYEEVEWYYSKELDAAIDAALVAQGGKP